MNTFLGELGKKIAERWVTVLVLPGLLWVSTALLATQLGWSHALSPHVLADRITPWADDSHPAVVIVVLLAGLLLASAAAGLVATALGMLVRRLWTTRGRWPPARRLTIWRQNRWRSADNQVNTLIGEALRSSAHSSFPPATGVTTALPIVVAGPGIAEALARRDAISLEFPELPTWIGDRWRDNAIRIRRAYGLDIALAWPRLWTVLPESLRADLTTAQTAYTAAGSLMGWATLYGLLGICWWPALLISIAVVTTGTIRARTATAALCQLIETAADLHGHTLAEQLRLHCPGPLTVDVGNQINALLRKDPPPSFP
ncbi:hypothetical protein ADL25_44680 [Streptomyces sp. NRRL F-5122]|uniref:hypothetical protein n=1 Tax=Streptomyces sp. NRRL F-5122 TaxID=1609098 RepID=UPI0007412080|nr:hypothetical protein [Streptomyces sp. NRRL F-5122]KUJ33575.1 hypothetical protein ADL25_44680 [Streptomyces sp. NRRL F-5122]